MSFTLTAAVRHARNTQTEAEARGVITRSEALAILREARSNGIPESRLRSALGRSYVAPLAVATSGIGIGSFSLSAGYSVLRCSVVLNGSAGSVSVTFAAWSEGATAHMRTLAFSRLVEMTYGLERGSDLRTILAQPELRALQAEFMDAAVTGAVHHFQFPPLLTGS
jgi:hypothetical protein